MFKKNFQKHKHYSDTGFRYRGIEGSRLEYLTDAVFAFSITLLVIAPEVPTTYLELKTSMYGFVGFIACILLLLGLWGNHSTFFLRYGLMDRRTKTLNFLFLFVLLFYIYPLKYLFSYIGSWQLLNLLNGLGFRSDSFMLALEKTRAASMSVDDWEDLMIRFGLGLLIIYFIFNLMYLNALKKKNELELNKREVFETKSSIMVFVSLIFISMVSILVVLIGGGEYSGYSGMVYLVIPIALLLIRKYRTKRMDRLYPLNEQDLKQR